MLHHFLETDELLIKIFLMMNQVELSCWFLAIFKAKVRRKLQDLHTVLFIDDLSEILFDGFIGLLADEVFVCLNKIGDEFRAEFAAEY